MNARHELRRRLRAQRRALGRHEGLLAARQLRRRVSRAGLLWGARRIGCYLANDGEMDLAPLMRLIAGLRKQSYLPVLDGVGGKSLLFAPYRRDVKLEANRFGIPEPRVIARRRLHPRQLDLVLTPLVAFDPHGNRLGMGGGFYDRSLAFLKRRQNWRRPLLVGVAYDFQCVTELPSEAWDVPLDAIVTERRYLAVRRDRKETR